MSQPVIALAQINTVIGDFDGNLKTIHSALTRASEQGTELVVFAELALCGYPPRDFLEFDDFIGRCEQAVAELCEWNAQGCPDMIIGVPTRNPEPFGKPLHNSALLISEGRVIHASHKWNLPTYDVFDEYRYFEPGRNASVAKWRGLSLAITVCEDLWDGFGERPLYGRCPLDQLEAVDLIVNVSASPFDIHHDQDRKTVMAEIARVHGAPLLYTNHVGAQTELIFDGGSFAMDGEGNVVHQAKLFEEEIYSFRLGTKAAPQPVSTKPHLIRKALVCGIRNYFTKLGFKEALVGLSGGIDSAVTLALAAEALGPEQVTAVLLPSKFSSQHSVDDSLAMVKMLGCRHQIISIKDVYDTYMSQLQPLFGPLPFGLAEENLQARIRAGFLMALSNKFGPILLNTTNKSEAAVGYGTLYGDMCGGLSVLGDVYKTAVYQLAEAINKNGVVIPDAILTKPPSAELRPDQLDSDSLPPYEVLDPILELYIEQRFGPAQIIAQGYDKSTVDRVLNLVNQSEYKRHQMAPVLRVSSKAFGQGRRLPIVGRYLK